MRQGSSPRSLRARRVTQTVGIPPPGVYEREVTNLPRTEGRIVSMPTELLYLHDAHQQVFDAEVIAVRQEPSVAVALDRTAFYPTGGGQPHDTGTIGGPGRHRRAQGGRRRVAHRRGRPAARRRRIGWRRDRLGPPPCPHAHPHRAARAVRGDLERVGHAGHRRQHGAACRPGWTSSSTRCPRASAPRSRSWSTPSSRPTARSRCRSCRGATAVDGRRPHPHQGQPDPRVGAPRSGSSTSSGSTSRPTAAPTCAPPTRSAGSGS